MTSARAVACPACHAPMRALAVERRPHGQVDVDLCPACRGLWFDAHESVQLTAASTLALFREVAALGEAPPPAAGSAPLRCPRCGDRLAQTHDMQRATRFNYWRCVRGHGRFTPFIQFMREKDFVRPLARDELDLVRAQIGTVRCSGCGAPVDLGRSPGCNYCGARVEVLDPAAIRKALAQQEKAAAGSPAERPPPSSDAIHHWLEQSQHRRGSSQQAVDLVLDGLASLLDFVRGR